MAAPKGQEFETFQVELAPPWLQAGEAGAFLRAFGRLKDRLVARAKEAAKVGLPSVAPSDALPAIGADVVLERGSAESEESYRSRLGAAFSAWKWAGTKKGLLEYALAPAGFPNCGVIVNREWARDHGGIPPDGNEARWSRWWLVIAAPHPFGDDGLWADDSDWGEGGALGIWGTTATAAEIARVRRLVTDWSPVHSRCEGVFVVLAGGESTSPDGAPNSAPWTYLDLSFDGEFVTFWQF